MTIRSEVGPEPPTSANTHDIEAVSSARVPTAHGEFDAHVFRANDGTEHLALVCGDIADSTVLARVHSECLTGDVLASLRCDCGDQLQHALAKIGAAGAGVVVYLRGHEGRGIGIGQKIAAYALQDAGLDTVDANVELGLPVDNRSYDTAALILMSLGVKSVHLMTNNPAKVEGLRKLGLEVERVAMKSAPNLENLGYLRAKQLRMGHMIDGLGSGAATDDTHGGHNGSDDVEPRRLVSDSAGPARGTRPGSETTTGA